MGAEIQEAVQKYVPGTQHDPHGHQYLECPAWHWLVVQVKKGHALNGL